MLQDYYSIESFYVNHQNKVQYIFFKTPLSFYIIKI